MTENFKLPMLQRHKVFKSDRIKVTENIIKDLNVSRVLEIGAGDYSFDYTKSQEKISWQKLDFSPPCDVICDLNSDKLLLPFPDEIFDLIICTEVLEHLLWPQKLLKEVQRVLSRDGKLLLSVPNIVSFTYRIAWMIGHIPSCAASANLPPELGSTTYRKENSELTGGHVIDFNLKRIVSLLQFIGFKIVSIKGSGIIWHRQILPHWIVPTSLASNIICLAKK
jgi:SAM-dependent methyltransferase